MFDTLLLASNNVGKHRELSAFLRPLQISVQTPSDLGINLEVEEDGETYRANAEKKARAFSAASKLPSLADDSGIELTAFGSWPGVHSARWLEGSDTDRNRAVLEKLADHSDRSARFVCVLCLATPETEDVQFWRGEVHGSISDAIRGAHGFGYDPIFIPDGYSQSFSELDPTVKASLSHRARALAAFAADIQQ